MADGRRRRGTCRPGALLAARPVLVALVALAAPWARLSAAPGTATAAQTTAKAAARGPRLSYGVRARWVVEQNSLPGTTAWEIAPGRAGGISGFASSTYAVEGEEVTLYVSTRARSFRVDAYRMGWYQGKGARLVWRSRDLEGRRQPACTRAASTNMVACDNWAPSLRFEVTARFVQGDYLLELVGSGGQRSYVPLTVADLESRSAYLVKNDVYTWQAWNDYGGYDFYAGRGTCPPGVYPLCSRARVVSFDRPYAYGDGAGDFLGSEYPLVRLVEEHGLDVSYATDQTVQQHPGILLRHRALLSLGHDECWSLAERNAADAAEARGVNIAFFGASAILRHVRLEASPLGPDREEVDYRDSAADPLDGKGNPLEVTGNTWASPPANWSEVGMVGEQYAGYLDPGAAPRPLVVAAGVPSWFLRGTRLSAGSAVPGVVAADFDEYDPAYHPADLEILAHSPIPLGQAVSDVGEAAGAAWADTTYWTDPASGAGIFDSGTTAWIPALSPCPAASLAGAAGRPGSSKSCPAAVMARLTGNLLALFGQGPAGRVAPAVSNLAKVYAPMRMAR